MKNVLFYIYAVSGLLLAPAAFIAGTVMQRDSFPIRDGLAAVFVIGTAYISLLILFTFFATLRATRAAIERECAKEDGVALQEA